MVESKVKRSSYFEGMSISLMQAMLSGCLVMATAVGGNVELIEVAKSGWLNKPNDCYGLSHTIDVGLNRL